MDKFAVSQLLNVLKSRMNISTSISKEARKNRDPIGSNFFEGKAAAYNEIIFLIKEAMQ